MKKLAFTLALLSIVPTSQAAAQNSIDLTGLWEAKVRFGPDIRGPLTIVREGNTWRADIAGFTVPARSTGRILSFELPNQKGSFRGTVSNAEISGHWVGQINNVTGRAYATPVILKLDRAGLWRGNVQPLDDALTFFLPVKRSSDGKYTTHLRNPERNQGLFMRISGIELNGDVVKLIGRRGNRDTALIEGRYDNEVMRIPLRDTFDFRKGDHASGYYARPKSASRYTYTKPAQLSDGWPVASVEDAGISREQIEKFVQMLIDVPEDSLTTPRIHSLLIARDGKLVLEEYFHGYHRDVPHDLRSASKSWTTVLIGAAMQAGLPISPGTPVYQTMLGSVPRDLDPRKRAMTLEHLISQTSGYDCSGPEAPGDESVMQNQTAQPDWIRYALNVPLRTAPGDTIVYCGIGPDLAAGVLRKIAGESLPDLFYRLVARPLQMTNYHLMLSPVGDVYGAGGHHFMPRDFMKLPQLMLNEGKWNGKQIFSREWARQSGAPLRNLTRTQQYGWLWNSMEYQYKGRKVRGFFAGGNGGQIFMGIPELDLVIAVTGGNYGHIPSTFYAQRVYIPNFILPAVN
jgi:CubicO group peptidase (beta-lactamase class C family)